MSQAYNNSLRAQSQQVSCSEVHQDRVYPVVAYIDHINFYTVWAGHARLGQILYYDTLEV